MAARRSFLEDLFRTAVAAAHPAACLPPLLPEPPADRLVLLAAGKAAGSMAEVAEAHYLDRLRISFERLSGVAVARHGYARHLRRVRMIEAGHPIPDAAGLEARATARWPCRRRRRDDLVLVLMSGGASANWIAPAEGISLDDKQAVTRALLRSGASIGEINTVRKHLSRIKGGRLARHAHPAKLVTIAISDVPGDDPSAIGSGPTVPDPTTLADARAIVAKYKLEIPDIVTRALDDAKNEIAKARRSRLRREPICIGRAAGRRLARRRGCRARGGLRMHPRSATVSKAKHATSPPLTRALRATCGRNENARLSSPAAN